MVAHVDVLHTRLSWSFEPPACNRGWETLFDLVVLLLSCAVSPHSVIFDAEAFDSKWELEYCFGIDVGLN